MSEKLNSITIGEILIILTGIISCYSFIQKIIVPIVRKWLKIEENYDDIKELSSLPSRVSYIEAKIERDNLRLHAIEEVNVLMMEALLALIKNKVNDGNSDELLKVENKLTGFLVGKVNHN